MAVDESKRITPATLGSGVYDPRQFRQFSPEEGTVVRMYDDEDVSANVWNLEPGQVNSTHTHPNRAHVAVVLEGVGQYLRGDADAVPIKAGDCVIAPRGAVHGFRNTGYGRLSYLVISNTGGGAYVRERVGS